MYISISGLLLASNMLDAVSCQSFKSMHLMNQCLQSEGGVAALQQEHKGESNKLLTVSAAPEKARRQADMAVAELASAQV